MGSGNNRLSLEEVKKMDMVDFLASIGRHHDPIKSKGNEYWYNSPFRDEKTPSFRINRRTNRWRDFGPLPGQVDRGNVIDFAIQYYSCSVGDFLSMLRAGNFPNVIHVPGEILPAEKEPKVLVTQTFPLRSYPLLSYALSRAIPLDVIREFCCEVRYELNGRQYYGIGFKSDSGAYEIRNAYVKTCNMPKDITTIDKGSKKVVVFEGFFDFLSYMTINRNTPAAEYNFLILNTTAFFEKARAFMEKHEHIGLYLDHGKGGRQWTEYALNLSSKYSDKSSLYKGYDDLNDWHVKSAIDNKLKKGQHL